MEIEVGRKKGSHSMKRKNGQGNGKGQEGIQGATSQYRRKKPSCLILSKTH